MIGDLFRRRQDYRRTFESEHGKRVLLDMARRHFLYHSTKVAGDAGESAFREGRRAVVLELMATLRMKEEDLMKLPEETEGYD